MLKIFFVKFSNYRKKNMKILQCQIKIYMKKYKMKEISIRNLRNSSVKKQKEHFK